MQLKGMADISLEIRRLKMSDKDKYKFNLKDGLDQWVMMIFLADIGALLIVLLGVFFNSGFDDFSVNSVVKIVLVLILIAAAEVFGWTVMSAYINKRSNK